MKRVYLLVGLALVFAGCKKKAPSVDYGGNSLYIYSSHEGNFDIYILNPSDGSLQKVIGTPADEKYPFVYNDKIYFSSNDDGDYDIYVANLDGSGRTRITNYPEDESEPVVSPDGKYLAFTWGSPRNHRVMLYDLQANDTVKGFGNAGFANMSPYFVGNDTLLMTLQDYSSAYSQEPWIYIISTDALIHLNLDAGQQEGHWNVKNGKVAFAQMGLHGENPHASVADFPSFSNKRDIYSHSVLPVRPIFSPNGGFLAVGHEGMCLIVAVDISSGSVDTLYNNPSGECYPYFWK